MPERYEREIEPLGLGGLLSSAIVPHDEYLTLCLRGAYSWGSGFGDHFLNHTWLADNRRCLREWLSPEDLEARLA